MPARALIAALCVALCAAVAAQSAGGQSPADFFDALDHPAIGYHTVPPTDPVAQLARRIAAGTEALAYDENTGYLPAVLRTLNIPISSQLAVFSKTSLQQRLISPQNPRALYFGDSVVVAWPRGGFIEIAAHDPRQGVVFYALPQQRADPPLLVRRTECLQCHHSYATGGVPGLLVRSVITGPRGEAMPFLGNYQTDDRSPLDERWAGWFVTGSTGRARHLGNLQPPFTRDVDVEIAPQASTLRTIPDSLRGYPSQESDVAAHLVFDHQVRVINLLTRTGWEVRVAQAENRSVDMVAARQAQALVDALLFVDEAALPAGIAAGAEFTTTFVARGPFDNRGRTLRALDLRSRLMRYPCSFMIYSEAFDALPAALLDATYRRLWTVLSGNDRSERYVRLSAADRSAVVEILRATKKGLPAYYQQSLRDGSR